MSILDLEEGLPERSDAVEAGLPFAPDCWPEEQGIEDGQWCSECPQPAWGSGWRGAPMCLRCQADRALDLLCYQKATPIERSQAQLIVLALLRETRNGGL